MITIISIFAFILGAVFASFFGVISSRVPEGLSIVSPGSRCDKCGHELKWYENIPILSWIFLGGRCSFCREKIPFSSCLFEIIGGVSLLLTVLKFGLTIETIFIVVIVLLLLLIASFDHSTSYILDWMWISLLVVVLGFTAYKIFVCGEDFKGYLFGLITGAGFFGLVKLIGYLVFKKDALGLGDVILMGIAGGLLGPYKLLIATLVGSVLGVVIEIPVLLIKKDEDHSLPFCPYLCSGIFIALLYGDNIVEFLEGVILNGIL